MGIGDQYVYTIVGIGEKALIHGLLLKSVVSLFSAFSERNATTQTTWKTDYGAKNREKRGYSLIRK